MWSKLLFIFGWCMLLVESRVVDTKNKRTRCNIYDEETKSVSSRFCDTLPEHAISEKDEKEQNEQNEQKEQKELKNKKEQKEKSCQGSSSDGRAKIEQAPKAKDKSKPKREEVKSVLAAFVVMRQGSGRRSVIS